MPGRGRRDCRIGTVSVAMHEGQYYCILYVLEKGTWPRAWLMQKGIMSRAQFCDMGALRRLSESSAPYFRKRLTSAMLTKSERLGIPKEFVHEHGDRFHRVLSLTGSNGKSRSVTLAVRGADTRARVYLCGGWIGFAKENGFQMGDEVIFWLVASSSFRVLLCSPQSLEKATSTRTNSSKGDEADGTSDDAITSELAPQHPNLGRQVLRKGTSASITNHEEIQLPPCHVNSNTVESQVPACCLALTDWPMLTTSTYKEWKIIVSENKTSHVASTEGTMSSTDRGILRRLQESNAPIFGKTLTRSMLRRTERLEIPSSFLREHGDRFHRMLSLTGPNDKSRSVPLTVRTSVTRSHESPRVFLGRAWNAFAKENGFQVGDDVFFWLGASSTFRVLFCSPEFLQRATTETIKGDEDYGTSDGAITSEFAPQHSKANTTHEDIQFFPPGDVNSTPAEAHSPAPCVEAVPPERPTSSVREKEYGKYPGLNSAVSVNSRFPQFLKKLTPNNLNGRRMELPFSFVKEHGDKLQGHVTLLGTSDHLRAVDLRVTTFLGQGRVHLGKGWKDFSLENGFSVGDVLLFSLVGVSTFVVKMFPGARRLDD